MRNIIWKAIKQKGNPEKWVTVKGGEEDWVNLRPW
jgi:hypothetical protein